MPRLVLPELLDDLPPRDAAALRSRRELRRINAWMGHPRRMAGVLRQHWPGSRLQPLAELGAGDGYFLLSVVQRLKPDLGGELTLVDQLDAVDPETRAQFGRLGWRVRVDISGATPWLARAATPPPRAIISNLFFHQFQDAPLREMLRLAAAASRLVIALEPRRSWLSRRGGNLLWLLGCGPVTRHDARISIHAGFTGAELSALWPDRENWTLTERPAGWCSHLFIAKRKD
jgi:hypothetical protein